MTDWQGKFWGRTRCVCDTDLYSQHELELKAGGYCSIHYHESRANRFFIHSGRIAVVTFHAWAIDRKILTSGNALDVRAGVVHQFQVLEDGEMVEEYYPDGGPVRNDDIVRLCQGGVNKVEFLDDLAHRLMRQHGNLWSK